MHPSTLLRASRVTDHALSQDGLLVVYSVLCIVDDERYVSRIWTTPVDGSSKPQPLTAGPSDYAPSWSPDGKHVAFLRQPAGAEPSLCVVASAGGGVQVIAQHERGVGMAASPRALRGTSAPLWAPDGSRIAYVATEKRALHRTSLTGTTRYITTRRFRFDGRGYTHDNVIQVFLADPAGAREPHRLTDGAFDNWDVNWRPDGQALCLGSSRHEVTGRDAAQDAFEIDLAGKIRRLTDTSTTVNLPTYSRDGYWLYFTGIGGLGEHRDDIRGRNVAMWRVDTAGDSAPLLLSDPQAQDFDDVRLRPLIVDDDGVLAGNLTRGSIELGEVRDSGWHPIISGKFQVVGYDRKCTSLSTVVRDTAASGDLVVRVNGHEKKLTHFSDDNRGRWNIHEREEVTAAALDGYFSHGWLATPDGPGPHQLIVLIHGGPDTQHGYELYDELELLCAHGYAVLLPNPRGSAGYGEAHTRAITAAYGTVDAMDILALIDEVQARPDIADGRVGVWGQSYGGFLTAWLAAHHADRFAAAIGECGVYSWDLMLGTSDIGIQIADMVGADQDMWAAQAPLSYAHMVTAPFLVIAYTQDLRVPIEQSVQFYSALKDADVDTELAIFEGGPHNFRLAGPPPGRIERLTLISDWFEEHL